MRKTYYLISKMIAPMERISTLPMSRQEIIATLQQEKPIIQEKYGIAKIGLFGSFAREEAGPMSDIDLLVSFEAEREQFRPYMQCKFYLEQIFGKKVELITKKSRMICIQMKTLHILSHVLWRLSENYHGQTP